MADTAIEWCTKVWNPTTGCDRVSPGCDHCYALTMAKRLKAMGSAKYQNDGDPRTSGPGFGVTEHPTALGEPFKWEKPERIFVNSMSDLFHPKVSDGFIARVWRETFMTAPRPFQARFDGPCRTCPNSIEVGDLIRKVDVGSDNFAAYVHADCPDPQPEPDPLATDGLPLCTLCWCYHKEGVECS